jgi:DamX protein
MTDSPDPDAPDHKVDDNPDLAGFLHSESPRRRGEPDPTESLRRPPPPPGDPGDAAAGESTGDVRDLQKSLVERIADVDDDRRRTSVQLRKALETHRDEIRAQRQRDHTALLVLTGIGIVLLAAVLLLFNQLFQTRSSLEERLAQLEGAAAAPQDSAPAVSDAPAASDAIEDLQQRMQRLEQGAEADTGTEDVAARLERLEAQAQPAGSMGKLDERLTRLEQRGSSTSAEAAPIEEIDELADAIEAIGDRLTALEGRLGRLADAGATGASAQTGAAAEDAPQAAELTAAVAAAEQRLEDQLAQKLAALSTQIGALREQLAAPPVSEASAAAAETAAEPTEAEAGAEGRLTTAAGTIALQLAGFPSRAAIDRFIARQPLPERVYLTVDTWRGRSWYGLVHSLHPDMEAAEGARAQLPPQLARLDIWLRELPAGSRLQILDGRP